MQMSSCDLARMADFAQDARPFVSRLMEISRGCVNVDPPIVHAAALDRCAAGVAM